MTYVPPHQRAEPLHDQFYDFHNNPYRRLPSNRIRRRIDRDYDEEEDETSCATFSKYAIFGFNILFTLVGIFCISLGVWLRVDSRFRDFLSERYRQAVDEAFWQAPTLYTFSYLIIALGSLMVIVSTFGCCGAVGKSRLLIGVYGFGVLGLLIATVSCGVYIIYKKDGIDVELADALNYMVQHYYQGPGIVQESLDRLQQAFRCCGNAGCSDFRAFRQDPPRTCDIRCDGCHYRIWLALRIGFSIALVIFTIVMLAQIVAVGVSAILVFREKEERDRYRYRVKYTADPRRNYDGEIEFNKRHYRTPVKTY